MRAIMIMMALLTATLGLAGSVKDPFTLIEEAKTMATGQLPAPTFLTAHTFAGEPSPGCNTESWEYVFTDHQARKTGFTRFYETMTDGVCTLSSSMQVVDRYPWIGVREMESLLPTKTYQFSDAVKKVEEIVGPGTMSFDRMEIYRPNHPDYSKYIYGRFVGTKDGQRFRILYNFMTGHIE